MSRQTPAEDQSYRLYRQLSVPTQVHLRRMTVADALEKLDRYLNDATVTGIPAARVIHGKGTGTLKAAVLDFLTLHALVARHYPASPARATVESLSPN